MGFRKKEYEKILLKIWFTSTTEKSNYWMKDGIGVRG